MKFARKKHCRWTLGKEGLETHVMDALRNRWSTATVKCAFRLANRMSVSTVESSLFLPGPIRSKAVRVPTVLAMFCLVSTGTRDWTSFTSLDKGHRTDTVGDKSLKRYTVYRAGAWFQFTSYPYRYIRCAASLAVEQILRPCLLCEQVV